MYSIIQDFGINYAENSSIIKQIKKPETGDMAGSPSEDMGRGGRPDPAEGQEGRAADRGGPGEAEASQGLGPWDPHLPKVFSPLPGRRILPSKPCCRLPLPGRLPR